MSLHTTVSSALMSHLWSSPGWPVALLPLGTVGRMRTIVVVEAKMQSIEIVFFSTQLCVTVFKIFIFVNCLSCQWNEISCLVLSKVQNTVAGNLFRLWKAAIKSVKHIRFINPLRISGLTNLYLVKYLFQTDGIFGTYWNSSPTYMEITPDSQITPDFANVNIVYWKLHAWWLCFVLKIVTVRELLFNALFGIIVVNNIFYVSWYYFHWSSLHK